jgi:hypothetical protein
MQESQTNTVGFKYSLEKRKKIAFRSETEKHANPKKKPKKIRSMVEAVCRTKLWPGGGGVVVGGQNRKKNNKKEKQKRSVET